MVHEKTTEKFFAHGIERYGTFHGNYLNFGLWEKGITDYVKAAENMIYRVGSKVELNKKSNLLDVACGMGAQDLFMIKTFKCKKITAVDLTTKHVTLAKERNTSSDVTYQVGNACDLPFKKETFTHVTGIEGPVNFITREEFFQEAYRVLKHNGRLGISDFTLKRTPKNKLEVLFLKFCIRLWHIPWDNADTKETYKQKLEQTGFTNVDIEDVSEYAYPGYYNEQAKPETRKALNRIRGPVIGRISFFIDWITDLLYRKGLIGYILVSAEKK
ncbi:MAG: methyltransferase domain-containing protein [Candidatus Nanoarchaeia archaeon]